MKALARISIVLLFISVLSCGKSVVMDGFSGLMPDSNPTPKTQAPPQSEPKSDPPIGAQPNPGSDPNPNPNPNPANLPGSNPTPIAGTPIPTFSPGVVILPGDLHSPTPPLISFSDNELLIEFIKKLLSGEKPSTKLSFQIQSNQIPFDVSNLKILFKLSEDINLPYSQIRFRISLGNGKKSRKWNVPFTRIQAGIFELDLSRVVYQINETQFYFELWANGHPEDRDDVDDNENEVKRDDPAKESDHHDHEKGDDEKS